MVDQILNWVLVICMIGLFIAYLGYVGILEWLKGSRTSYYMSSHGPAKTAASLRSPDVLRLMGYSGVVLEVARGFLKRSRIIGHGLGDIPFWSIAKSWRVPNPAIGYTGDRVSLVDLQGISAERAIGVVKQYLSLEELLDDFKRTKSALVLAQGHNEEFQKRLRDQEELWNQTLKERDEVLRERCEARLVRNCLQDGILAILHEIDSDRQKYRSKPSQHIRESLQRLHSEVSRSK